MEWIYISSSSYYHRPLPWRHDGRDSVSNHQPHDCSFNRLFRRRSKKTSKLRVTGLCVGNSPGTGEFPAQMASKTENVSIWWRVHANRTLHYFPIVSCFPRLCVWGSCTCIFCHLRLAELGKTEVFVCLHITPSHHHHYTDLSESIEPKHENRSQNTWSDYYVEYVSKNTSIFSIIFYAMYLALCFQLICFSLDESICALFWYHYQIRNIAH